MKNIMQNNIIYITKLKQNIFKIQTLLFFFPSTIVGNVVNSQITFIDTQRINHMNCELLKLSTVIDNATHCFERL